MPVAETVPVDVLVDVADVAFEPDTVIAVNATPVPTAEAEPATEIVDEVGQVALF